MAYETGTATSEQDLLDKLRIFSLAQGWTVNRFGTRADDATGKELYLTKGGKYFAFITTTAGGTAQNPSPRIHPVPVTGYGAGIYSAQPGYAGSIAGANNMGGPYVAYHFFADVDYIHCVVEATGGSFRHFGFGTMEKFGSYTGGEYVYAQNWSYSNTSITSDPNATNHARPFDWAGNGPAYMSTYARADVDGATNKWFLAAFAAAIGTRLFCGMVSAAIELLRACSPNAFNGLSVLSKPWCAVQRTGGTLYSPIGAPKDLRYVDITNFTPGQEITIGPDTWKVFPIIVKNGATNTPNSGVLGLGFRKF